MKIEVGMEVFSKNGTEFYSNVSSVNGSRITVAYEDDYMEEETVDASCFTEFDGILECPNWTFSFEQISYDEEEDE